jgi:putative flippase GtrA
MTGRLRPAAATGGRQRFLRFLLTGLVNTAFGYGIYAALVLLGLPPQTALALAFIIGVLWNYAMHARFVFGTRGYARLPAYGAVYVALYALNALALGAALRAGVAPLLAQAVLTVVMAGISFIAISLALTGSLPGRRRAG